MKYLHKFCPLSILFWHCSVMLLHLSASENLYVTIFVIQNLTYEIRWITVTVGKYLTLSLQLSSTSLLSKWGSAVYTRSSGSVKRALDVPTGCTVTSSIPKSTIVASTKPSLGSGTQTTCSILKNEDRVRCTQSFLKLVINIFN